MNVSVWVTVSDLVATRHTPMEMAIGLFDKKQKMFHALPHDEIFHSLKKSGVDGMELLIPLYTSDKNIKEVKEIVRKNTIPILSIHQSLSHMSTISLYEIQRLCQIANIFSASVIVLHSGTLGKKLLDSDFIHSLKKLQKKHAVTFGIENMSQMPLPAASYTYKGEEFSSLLKKTGLSITFDTTHLGQTGGNIIPFYMTNKEKIVNIHLSDYKRTWLNAYLLFQDHTHMPLGKGELPIESLLKLLKKDCYKGLITMEINAHLTQLCESAKMIKGYIQTHTYQNQSQLR